MIRFMLALANPWAKNYKDDKNLFEWHKSFFKEKGMEIEIGQWGSYNIFRIDFDLSWTGSSHAGPRFCIEVLRYSFEISFYDGRHWDYEKGKWEVYDDDQLT